jgi:hypothetical protein
MRNGDDRISRGQSLTLSSAVKQFREGWSRNQLPGFYNYSSIDPDGGTGSRRDFPESLAAAADLPTARCEL